MAVKLPQNFDDVVEGTRSASASKSAVMGPLLFLDAIVFAAAAGASLRGETKELQIGLFCCAAVVGLASLLVYLWLLWKKPHLLQSDRYQIVELLSRRVGDNMT
ncbi:hypothetical protein ARNL5_01052 [Anaerolineae bacterium]|nr:hypothetical protein ARNL5_01052 [Anaerolineae bacterium]